MKRIALLVFCVTLSVVTLLAQDFNVGIETRPSDIKNYKKYKFVVEVLSADAKAITKLKKIAKDQPNALKNYNKFIESYNENIKKALTKYWNLTDTIMYLSKKEIKRLKESRERNILVLTAVELGGEDEFITRLNGTALQLNFYNLKKSTDEADYKIMMPYSYSRTSTLNPLTDYLFIINMTVRNLKYMKDKKTTSDCFDFMETEAMANCKKLAKKTLLIDEVLVSSRADSKGMKKYFKKKKLKIVKRRDYENLQNTITNGSIENTYMVLIPYSTISNPFARDKPTYVLCYKVIVDADGGVVLNYTKGKPKATPDVSLVQEKDFRGLDECDF